MPDFPLALLAVIPLAVVELAKASRWRALFGVERPSYVICLRALLSGQVTNALSPVRAGEAVRLGVLVAQGGALVPGAGAMAGAKAIDAVCLAAIAFAVAGTSILQRSAGGFLVATLIVFTGVVASFRAPKLRELLLAHRLTRRLRLTALVDVALALRDRRVLANVLLNTSMVWVAGMLANGFILAAVGITPTMDLMARIIVAGYLVSMLPAPPAQIGTFEAAVSVALTSAGVPFTTALAASVSLHLCQFVKLGGLLGISLLMSVNWAKYRDRRPAPPVPPTTVHPLSPRP
jgi:uncharacterized membrane protein YbhN (UPF0104 family)